MEIMVPKAVMPLSLAMVIEECASISCAVAFSLIIFISRSLRIVVSRDNDNATQSRSWERLDREEGDYS